MWNLEVVNHKERKNRDDCEFKSNNFKNEVKEEPLKVIAIISTTLNDTLLNKKKMFYWF